MKLCRVPLLDLVEIAAISVVRVGGFAVAVVEFSFYGWVLPKQKLTFLPYAKLLTRECYTTWRDLMKNGKRRSWTTADVRTLKTLARKRTRAGKIAQTLKRTEGATRQKAFSLGVSLDARL